MVGQRLVARTFTAFIRIIQSFTHGVYSCWDDMYSITVYVLFWFALLVDEMMHSQTELRFEAARPSSPLTQRKLFRTPKKEVRVGFSCYRYLLCPSQRLVFSERTWGKLGFQWLVRLGHMYHSQHMRMHEVHDDFYSALALHCTHTYGRSLAEANFQQPSCHGCDKQWCSAWLCFMYQIGNE